MSDSELQPNIEKPKHIWELDAFRGFCILCVIVIHTVFDIQEIFRKLLHMPDWYDFIQEYGGALFIILSGICITLGHKHIKRGLIVLGGALVISAVTAILFSGSGLVIWFGILHLLAFCMLTYSLYQKLPSWLILIMGIAAFVLGIWLSTKTVHSHYLFPLGLLYTGFSAGDYFPIFPNLGYFMMGVFLGRTLYKDKKTLFPKVNENNVFIKFFSFCGRHSLLIYLGHQPVCYGLLMVISLIS